MPNKTISMIKLRQVIRLYHQGKGSKSIASTIGLSRTTVKKYIRQYNRLGFDYETFSGQSDMELSERFQAEEHSGRKSEKEQSLESILPDLVKQLKKKGVSQELIYRRYKEQYPEGYSFSHFKRFLRLYKSQMNPIMHMEHKAGDKMFIDFAGTRLRIEEDGVSREVEVFVAILGCSQLTYVEAVSSQKKEDLVKASENALHYFGGSPLAIVPDNLRSAVTKGSRYEAVINDTFACFAEHYGCTVLPARVYKPRDKSLVEGAVKLVYRNIYTMMENRTFHDLQSINEAIRVAVEIYNNRPFSHKAHSRRQLFEQIERDTLQDLPPYRYRIREQSVLTVNRSGHVRLGSENHFYSVPTKYIGKRVTLIHDRDKVDIYCRHILIATHERDMRPYQYTTLSEHLAPNHRYLMEWDAENFIRRGKEIHGDVAAYVEKVLEETAYPEKAYKSCSGILNLARKVGAERLAGACRYAYGLGQFGYRTVEDVLQQGLDRLHIEEESAILPTHENIRGNEYYQ